MKIAGFASELNEGADIWLRQHRHDVLVPKPFVDEAVEAEQRRRKARAERKRLRQCAGTEPRGLADIAITLQEASRGEHNAA